MQNVKSILVLICLRLLPMLLHFKEISTATSDAIEQAIESATDELANLLSDVEFVALVLFSNLNGRLRLTDQL